jgi:uncharacterized phiE125 gp8 family phage protein
MSIELVTPALSPAVSISDLRAYLRLEHDIDDARIASLIRTASDICEQFLGALLLNSQWRQTEPATTAPIRLKRAPVRAVSAVWARDINAVDILLNPTERIVDIDADGLCHARLLAYPADAQSLIFDFTAGQANDPNGIPEAIRQGILRLAAHLYDQPQADAFPPTSVAALWRPYRRLRLS